MDAYRDELFAARERIASLESELAAAEQQVGKLSGDVKTRDEALHELRAVFNGEPAAKNRWLGRFALMAIAILATLGGTAVALVTQVDADAARERAERAERMAAEERSLRERAERRAAAPAQPDVVRYPAPEVEPMRHAPVAPGKYDPTAIKASLLAKMRAGLASKSELRMLVAICSGDGDKPCRNEAYAAWKEMSE